VHWEERNRIMDDARRGLSRATTVWGQTRNDPQLRAAEEIRATEAARKFYQEFIDACGNLFGVGRPSVAI
jgi:catalase (peroxidase I)